MRYIPLGKTDLTVSEVGFGGIPIIHLDEDSAVTVLRRAYESGITLYDTADSGYAEGTLHTVRTAQGRKQMKRGINAFAWNVEAGDENKMINQDLGRLRQKDGGQRPAKSTDVSDLDGFRIKRMCRNGENAMFVILNEVKNLMISTESIIEILRLSLRRCSVP
jgi:hypothetical protein